MIQQYESVDVTSGIAVNDPKSFKFNMNESYAIPENSPDISKVPEVSNPVLGTFSGIFAGVDMTSGNGRYYSRDFWTSVIKSEEVQNDLKKGSMLGIFEHPTVTEIYDQQGHPTMRHPQNGAFVVKDLNVDGDYVIGEAYLLNTPLGRLLSTYFLAKDKYGAPLIQLFISARGYSNSKHTNSRGQEVMDPKDYFLQSFDVVMNPGFKDARVSMNSISNESLEENKNLISQLESQAQDTLNLWRVRQQIINSLNLHSIS